MGKKFSDKLIDCFFGKKLGITALFVVGFILRLISARNLGVSSDDVNHAVRPIGIFGSDKLVIFDQSTSLWYYIQGVFYKLFGLSQISSRFAAVLFGSLTILLMYLFVIRVFKSEKTALIASTLIAFSPLLIKNSMPEMDVTVAFFTLLSAYFMFGFFESRKNKDLLFAALFIGVATMIKLYALFFAFSFIFFLIYKEIAVERNIKKIVRRVLLFGIIVSILVIPTLTHNYLLYKDEGFMDLIFTNTLGLGVETASQYYSWSAGWLPKTDYAGFFLGNQDNFEPTPLPGFLIVAGFLLRGDPILTVLGLIGLIISFKLRRDYFWFFVILFVPAFTYLGAQIPLSKHFIWALVLITPLASVGALRLIGKIKMIKLKHLIIFILVFNLLYLGMPKDVAHSHFYGKSSFGQLIDFKNEISDNALVVVDSRIYRGHMHWGLAGKNYIDAARFIEVNNALQGQGQPTEVYYVECVIDDCGWGTIAGQPEFNSTMEQITDFFAQSSYFKQEFDGPYIRDYYLPFVGKREVEYRIYKSDLPVAPQMFEAAEKGKVWFLYPIGFDRNIAPVFDDFDANGFDIILRKIAWIIHYFELIVVFLTILYILYLFLDR